MAETLSLNGNLTLHDLISQIDKLQNGEITYEELQKWGANINIRANLPMQYKLAIIINLITDYVYSTATLEKVIVDVYVGLFFYAYLGGYLDIQGITKEDISYENYDLLEPYFGAWVEAVAGRDVNNLKEMLFNAINNYNDKTVMDLLMGFDMNSLKQQTESVKDLVRTLEKQPQTIENLNSISVLNDPAITELVNDIRKSALKSVKE